MTEFVRDAQRLACPGLQTTYLDNQPPKLTNQTGIAVKRALSYICNLKMLQ
jgi:hypothetical protein